jgi:hypothetical protein
VPVDVDGRVWSADLHPGQTPARLVSRCWVPAHVRPDASDTRVLGVAISRLWLDRREVSLESAGLYAGWHAPERELRWTDGNATLAVAGVRHLAFEVAMIGCYWKGARTYVGSAAASWFSSLPRSAVSLARS